MLIDEQGMLRADGSSPRVTATEAGSTSLTRDATTGKVVVPIYKTAQKGLPIVCINDADIETSTDKTLTVTIEASDALNFSSPEVVATFPAVSHGAGANLMVRRVHTQKRYLRSVITLAGSNGDISVDFLIFIGTGAMNED
jgi:hypothetical protein